MIIVKKQPTLPQNTSADGHNGFGRELCWWYIYVDLVVLLSGFCCPLNFRELLHLD